jgi:hypothetical protein
MGANSGRLHVVLEAKMCGGMTGNDQRQVRPDKSESAVIRKINDDAGAVHRRGRRPTMTSNRKSGSERRRLGWVWVWGVFVVFFAFEVARLS